MLLLTSNVMLLATLLAAMLTTHCLKLCELRECNIAYNTLLATFLSRLLATLFATPLAMFMACNTACSAICNIVCNIACSCKVTLVQNCMSTVFHVPISRIAMLQFNLTWPILFLIFLFSVFIRCLYRVWWQLWCSIHLQPPKQHRVLDLAE